MAAPYPGYYLTGFREWLLEDKDPDGMPAIVHFLRESAKKDYNIHITLPILGSKYSTNSIMREKNIVVHPYKLPRFFLPLISILKRKGHFILNWLFTIITLVFAFRFHRRLMLSIRPTFIYQMGYNILMGHFLSRSSGYPVIYRLFGTGLWNRLNRSRMRVSIYHWIHNFGELFISRHPGSLIVMTNDGTCGDKVLEILKCPASKRLFLLNGIKTENHGASVVNLRRDLPENVMLLVAMARLEAWKGVDRIIRAFPEALRRNSRLRLAVIGDGSQRFNLERLADKLGVRDFINFYGQIPNSSVVDTLRQADVFVSTQYISNLSNCLLEAILAGCPIISLSDGSLDGFLEDGVNAILLDPTKVQMDLPLVLEKLTQKKTLYFTLRRGVIKKAKTIWNWQQRINYELNIINRHITHIN